MYIYFMCLLSGVHFQAHRVEIIQIGEFEQ